MTRSLKNIFIATAILAATPLMAAADDLYAMEPSQCAIGVGGEGTASVGNGYFTMTETYFERTSAREDRGDGFFQATYNVNAEGEDYGPELMRVRVTEAQLDVINESDMWFTFTRCR